MKIILDGKKMLDKEKTHEYLKEKFSFPEYYGANLDSLWDLLNEINEDIIIKIINIEDIHIQLNCYGENLLSVFEDLEEERENIRLILE